MFAPPSQPPRRAPIPRFALPRSPWSGPGGASSSIRPCGPSPTRRPWPVPGAFGSSRWVVAHSLGIGAFTLLAVGALGAYLRFVPTAQRRSRWALFLTVLGAGLTLPYYGAEVFGLHAIGGTSLARHDVDLFTTLTDGVRWGPGIWFIVVGLILLAVGGVLAASAAWASTQGWARWSGVPLAVALVLYLPQFTGTQWVRVLHGGLMAVGCGLLAWALTRTGPTASEPPTTSR